MKHLFGLTATVAAASALLLAQSAVAQEVGVDYRLRVTPSATYSLADNDRLTDDGIGANISVGRYFTDALMLEVTAFFSQYDAENSASGQTLELTGAGLQALMTPLSAFPDAYVVVALHEGSTQDAPGARTNYRSTVFDAGLGYRFGLGDVLGGAAIRTEARYRMDSHESRNVGGSNDTEHYDGVLVVGLELPIGRYAEPEEEEQEVAQVSDSDGDGVNDPNDNCPNTPRGAVVDRFGCQTDTDLDGVVDRLDQCPGTPEGTEVDEVGCPLPAENCRPPFPGEPVDDQGCATGSTVVLRGVTFEFNRSSLTPNAKTILNGVADTLLGTDDLRVEVGGHTDSIGSQSYNQKLSQERAQSVVDYLTSRGVSRSRLKAKGYGEAQPIETNETEEGRAINRRVELKILD